MKKIIAILVLMNIFIYGIPWEANAHTHMELDFYEIFEHHGSVMLLIDSKTGSIEHANKAAADFYGYTIEQLESMKIHELNTLTIEETEKEIQVAADEQKNYFILEQKKMQKAGCIHRKLLTAKISTAIQ